MQRIATVHISSHWNGWTSSNPPRYTLVRSKQLSKWDQSTSVNKDSEITPQICWHSHFCQCKLSAAHSVYHTLKQIITHIVFNVLWLNIFIFILICYKWYVYLHYTLDYALLSTSSRESEAGQWDKCKGNNFLINTGRPNRFPVTRQMNNTFSPFLLCIGVRPGDCFDCDMYCSFP